MIGASVRMQPMKTYPLILLIMILEFLIMKIFSADKYRSMTCKPIYSGIQCTFSLHVVSYKWMLQEKLRNVPIICLFIIFSVVTIKADES